MPTTETLIRFLLFLYCAAWLGFGCFGTLVMSSVLIPSYPIFFKQVLLSPLILLSALVDSLSSPQNRHEIRGPKIHLALASVFDA